MPNVTKVGIFCQLDRFPITWILARFMGTHTRVLESVPEIDPKIDSEIDLGNNTRTISRTFQGSFSGAISIVGGSSSKNILLTCSNLALDVCSYSDFQTKLQKLGVELEWVLWTQLVQSLTGCRLANFGHHCLQYSFCKVQCSLRKLLDVSFKWHVWKSEREQRPTLNYNTLENVLGAWSSHNCDCSRERFLERSRDHSAERSLERSWYRSWSQAKLSITLKSKDLATRGFPKKFQTHTPNPAEAELSFRKVSPPPAKLRMLSQLTSGLESFGHKSTPSDRPWIEAYL